MVKLQNTHTHIIFKNFKAAKGKSEVEKKTEGREEKK